MIRTFVASAALAALMTVSLAGVADARERTFVARLAQPLAERVQVVADGALWTCEADACHAQVNQGAATQPGCRTLAREVGTLLSYGSETAPISDTRLSSCNEAARSSEIVNARN